MKHLLLTLLLATLCATGYGQTIKSLGYNTTNNRVVGPTNTNALVFTNAANFDGGAVFGGDVFINSFAISFGGTERINLEEARFLGEWAFDEPGAWRDNLGLGATWLTNTNVTNFRTDIGLGALNTVKFTSIEVGDTNGSFFTAVEDSGIAFIFERTGDPQFGIFNLGFTNDTLAMLVPISFNNTNDAATTRTNLGLGATNDVEFYRGTFNSAVEILEGTNAAVVLNPDSPSQFKEGISVLSAFGISFDGTNAPAARVSTMRALAGSTNTNQPHSGNLDVVGQLGNFTIVVSNGIIIDVTQ
jgi:hypothetical protein